MNIEVRCCCQPQKLLGWLPAPVDVRRGTSVEFVVARADWVLASVDSPPSLVPLDVVALRAETVQTQGLYGKPRISLAFKSEETPIERLRLIPGFVENHEP